MKQETKHKLSVLIVLILAMLLGGSANKYGQLKGVFAGVFLTYLAYLMTIIWFPRGEKK